MLKPQLRASLRIDYHKDPLLHDHLSVLPARSIPRRILSLAQLGLMLEKGTLTVHGSASHTVQAPIDTVSSGAQATPKPRKAPRERAVETPQHVQTGDLEDLGEVFGGG